MIVALDCEATGLDLFHGAKPYMVTSCDDQGRQRCWEWPVDPVTREPDVDVADVESIQQLVDEADTVIFHNAKYDVRALQIVGVCVPWEKAVDTIAAHHILFSNHPHNLTDAVEECLGVRIAEWEQRVKAATVACRKRIKDCGLEWRLAEKDLPEMPSVGGSDEESPWKSDMFLMRSLAVHIVGRTGLDRPYSDAELRRLDAAAYPRGWLTATREYGMKDTEVTLSLWLWCERQIKQRGYWKVFLAKLETIPLAYDLEERGITVSRTEQRRLMAEYGEAVEQGRLACETIAHEVGFDLELPAGASPNDSLKEMCWGSTRLTCPRCGREERWKEWERGPLVESRANGELDCPKCKARKRQPSIERRTVKRNKCLALPVAYSEKTGNPTLDYDALENWRLTLDPGVARDFVTELLSMRGGQTAISYMVGYERFWLPTRWPDVFVLHASYNPNGTKTLRWSSSHPNLQNISKQSEHNLRRCFGPAPGRELWSMDFKNVEKRIPAYESGEESLIALFENADKPPFWGSEHLLNFSIVYPDVWQDAVDRVGIEEAGPWVKVEYEDTWYQWIKNTGFALQYNCGERKADHTARRQGAYRKLKANLPKLEALNQRMIRDAKECGWVETIPDRSVDPDRGYPILASRREDGRVADTTPLAHHVSGTAMQLTNRAMVRCARQLREWNAEGWDGYMTLQVHDELVFDVPAGEGSEPWLTNLSKMRVLQQLMEAGGKDIGVPTPVSVEYHEKSWAVGKAM